MSALPPPPISLLVQSPTYHPFVDVLSTLLEPSAPLTTKLAPSLHEELSSRRANKAALPTSYNELLDVCVAIVEQWDIRDQAEFMSAHPRIGETKNLSAHSGKEQGGAVQTPGEVLRRLTILNALYEASFPLLRYTTFVNGRSRAEIIPEIETLLDLHLPPPSTSTPEPSVTALLKNVRVRVVGSEVWRDELKRGSKALWDIARSRLPAGTK